MASRSGDAKLNSRPAETSRSSEIASLGKNPSVRQPAPEPQRAPVLPPSGTAYNSSTANSAIADQGLRSPTAAAAAQEPDSEGTAKPLSPGEATELPVSHQPGDDAAPAGAASQSNAAQGATQGNNTGGGEAEDAAQSASTSAAATTSLGTSPGTSRELAPREAPPTAEVASLDLPGAGMPSSLRGSLASLERQNTRLESEGLERILDESDLSSRIAHGLLVPLPVSTGLSVNPNLIENHRFCRPWTGRFLADLARSHSTVFHRPLEVNSAVRTVEYQKRLMRTNGNAAAAEGDIVSPHLTGATIDIAKQGMTRDELMWMRRRLLDLQQAGKIDVEEEFEQACFHITVYKTYSPSSGPAHKTTSPAAREAANRHKAAPAQPSSSLPTSIAAGTFTPQSR